METKFKAKSDFVSIYNSEFGNEDYGNVRVPVS